MNQIAGAIAVEVVVDLAQLDAGLKKVDTATAQTGQRAAVNIG